MVSTGATRTPRTRHPRHDGLERAIADYLSGNPALRDCYISVVAGGDGRHVLQLETADNVVGFRWPTRRVMRYAALLQADRLQRILERAALTVHRDRRAFASAIEVAT